MQQQVGTFEISIEKEASGNQIDKNHVSQKAFDSYNVFVASVNALAKAQFKDNPTELTYDLGTNKVAINASQSNIDRLQKSIRDYQENKLPARGQIYKALHAIEEVISANGITYKTVIKGSAQPKDITNVFKKEKEQVHEELLDKVNVVDETGLRFYNGVIKTIDEIKNGYSVRIQINNNTDRYLICTAEQIFKLSPKYLKNVYFVGNFFKENKGKLVGTLIDEYTEKEFETFYNFYEGINKHEGTEKLKFIYRFFNEYIDKEELARVDRFARVFLFSTDVNVIRIMIDILKQVSDEKQIQDVYNDFIFLIKNKLGKSIY